MTKKKPPTPPRATRPAAKALQKPVDRFKRFHLACAIAPAFVTAFMGGRYEWTHEDLADIVVRIADLIAQRLDQP